MNHKKIGLLFTAIIGLMGAGSSTYAVAGITAPSVADIPASACSVYRYTDVHKLQNTSGSWRFGGTEKAGDGVRLECPYPGGQGTTGFNDYRVMFRDSDGTGTTSQVRVRFLKRFKGNLSAYPWFDSNAHGNTTDLRHRIEAVGATTMMDTSASVGSDEVGYFEVIMKKTIASPSVDTAFDGILLTPVMLP